jgi:hypothetical protein
MFKEFRVVETDNLGRDYPNETFASPLIISQAQAERLADLFNERSIGSDRYWKVVEMPYDLQPGFEP